MIDAAILFISPAMKNVTGGHADPLLNLPPRDEPAYLGVKLLVGDEQYGFLIGAKTLEQLGVEIARTDRAHLEVRVDRLVEGNSPAEQ